MCECVRVFVSVCVCVSIYQTYIIIHQTLSFPSESLSLSLPRSLSRSRSLSLAFSPTLSFSLANTHAPFFQSSTPKQNKTPDLEYAHDNNDRLQEVMYTYTYTYIYIERDVLDFETSPTSEGQRGVR